MYKQNFIVVYLIHLFIVFNTFYSCLDFMSTIQNPLYIRQRVCNHNHSHIFPTHVKYLARLVSLEYFTLYAGDSLSCKQCDTIFSHVVVHAWEMVRGYEWKKILVLARP